MQQYQLVQTTTHIKSIYRNLLVNYLVSDDVDAIRNLYQICRHLIHNKHINTLKKDLGDNYDYVMKNFNRFLGNYEYCRQLRQLIKETTDPKKKDSFKLELQDYCLKLPVINSAVIIVFESLVKNCDLRDIPPQHPSARDVVEKMPITFAED